MASASSLVICALFVASTAGAQTRVDGTELARARQLLDRSRPELSAEQWALLNLKLGEVEVAFAELTAVGLVAARLAGGRGVQLVVSATISLSFGVVVIALKTIVH